MQRHVHGKQYEFSEIPTWKGHDVYAPEIQIAYTTVNVAKRSLV